MLFNSCSAARYFLPEVLCILYKLFTKYCTHLRQPGRQAHEKKPAVLIRGCQTYSGFLGLVA